MICAIRLQDCEQITFQKARLAGVTGRPISPIGPDHDRNLNVLMPAGGKNTCFAHCGPPRLLCDSAGTNFNGSSNREL